MNESRLNANLEFWLPATLCFGVVIWFLIVPAWQNIQGSWSRSHWHQVEDQVTQSKAVKTITQEQQKTIYLFRYQYEVDGKNYENDRYSFRYPSGDKRMGVNAYRTGTHVTVHFDPLNPRMSVLEPSESPWWNYFALGFTAFVAITLYVKFRR